MNKARLLACPSCLRHVRVTEDTCPFCAGAVPASFRNLPAPRPPTRRLSRAALYAFGATSIGLVTACSGSVTNIPGDSGTDGSGEEAGQPLYGAAPAYGAFPEGGGDEMSHTLYGLPSDAEPPPDDGPIMADAAYGLPGDAGLPDGFDPDAIAPAYGLSGDAEPPFDAEPPPPTDDGGIAAYGTPPMH
jgi:hypothetical protein